MRTIRIPRSSFRSAGKVFFAGILCLTLSLVPCAGQSFAEELSDFEKLLREAIQSNQEENAEQVKSEKPVKKLSPTPEKKVFVPSSVTITEKEGTARTAVKTLPMGKPQKLDGGWEAVKPNDPSKIGAVEERILVADAVKTAAPKPANAAANTSVWDAEPETVPQGFEVPDTDTPEAKTGTEGKADDSQIHSDDSSSSEAKSPWDIVVSEEPVKEQTVEEPVKTAMKEDEPAAKTKGIEETVEPKKLTDAPAEEDKEAEEDKKAEEETIPETVKEEKKPAEKPLEPNSDLDITSILNLLEKDKDSKTDKQGTSEPSAKEEAEKEPKKLVAEKKSEENIAEETAEEKVVEEKVTEEKVQVKEEPKTETVKKETVEEKTEKTPLAEIAVKTPTDVKTEVEVPAFDADLDETKWKLVNADSVGDSFGKEKLKLMYDEIVNGLKTRNSSNRYDMWKNYARSTLRSTAGINTGSELDGRCRLEWYKRLYDEPVKSVFEADEFTRRLHHGLSGSHRHILESVTLMREKMDVAARNDNHIRFIECKTPLDAVNEVKRCLVNSQMGHARYLSTLTAAEKAELVKGLVPTFAGPGCVNGHTVPSRTYGRRLTDIIEKTDKTGLYDAGESLIPLTNTALLDLLDQLTEETFATVMLSGQNVQRLCTPAGDIIIGGRENNVYDLDSNDMADVVCIIDLGGNDIYRDGTSSLERPVLAVIDLHGNDVYTGAKPGIQGGSVLGVSFLLDREGDDNYSAGDIAQGSTIGGIGMLFDLAGKDSYKGLRRVQGHALHGLGILVDRAGGDKYRAAMWAQGFGAPGGFGVLEDVEGDDQYYCGGLYLDSYPEHPGYDGWGQGVGAGIRQVANGGFGALLEGSGNDVYEVDYFGHGGGYWLGVGFARDFGGNDVRHGATLTSYTGGPRQQSKWTRFANGFGCHYALGFCFDDSGNDIYGGTIMGTGMAWDLSIGYLCDLSGSDRYTATGGMTQGVGAEGSIGILFNYGGDDQFMGRNQGYASSSVTYHPISSCGGNISFVINYGGNDQYGCGAKNNTYVQRGTQSGFLIDRPTDNEAAEDLIALKEMIEKREKEIVEYDEALKKGREEAAARGRRYYPRQRRPMPISADQQSRLGSVPDFDSVGNAVSKAATDNSTVK